MKNHFLTVCALLSLSACADGLRQQAASIAQTMSVETQVYYQKHGEQSTIGAAKEAVRNSLKDPNSAQFSNVRIKKYAQGRIVCGNVNGRNSFGGYVGAQPFIASPSAAQIYTSTENRLINDAVNAPIKQACL